MKGLILILIFLVILILLIVLLTFLSKGKYENYIFPMVNADGTITPQVLLKEKEEPEKE